MSFKLVKIKRGVLVASFACCMASMAYETYTDGNGVAWKYTVVSGTNVSLGIDTAGDQAIGNNVTVDAADIPWTFEKDGTAYTVTKVSSYAFRDCNRTKNCLKGTLAFPDSVTEIGDYAFAYCSNLTSVAFNPNIQTIGKYAFGNNNKQGCVTATITDFDLSGCTSIGQCSFADMGRALQKSDRPHVRLLLTNPSLTSLQKQALDGCKASYIDVVLGRSVVTLTGERIFQNSYYTGFLIPGPQVVSSGNQTYTLLSKNNTFNYSTALELVFLGPTVKPSGTDKSMFDNTGTNITTKIYAPYANWNGTTWASSKSSGIDTYKNEVTLYGPGQAVDFALDDGLSLLTATPTTEAALVDVLTYAPQFKSRFGLDTRICVTNTLTSTGLVTKQLLQTASVTFDSLTFATRTQAELDNVLGITPDDVPLVIDPAGATEELRLTTQSGRKIHVLLPEGGSYKIMRNGFVIIVK